MKYLPNPRRLQFELSNVCNLHCLGCMRTETTFNSVKSAIGDPAYISVDTFYKIITDSELDSVVDLDFCGRIDDPLAHPDFLKMLEMAINHKPFKIFIHTNGGLRNPNYWIKLGELLKGTKHVVMFNVDGLEDTNHIYRQGSVWSNIIANAKAYISTGANSTWQYIEFPWNKHQIPEALLLSKELGFQSFNVRQDRSRIQHKSLEHIVAMKQRPQQLPEQNRDTFLLHPRYDTSYEITCMNKTDNMYFIDHTGKIWPCCFIPNGFIEDNNKIAQKEYLQDRIYGSYSDTTWNDCNLHDVSSIINHKFYTEDLVDSWNSNQHGITTKDRIFKCTETCSSRAIAIKPPANTTTKKFNQ